MGAEETAQEDRETRVREAHQTLGTMYDAIKVYLGPGKGGKPCTYPIPHLWPKS